MPSNPKANTAKQRRYHEHHDILLAVGLQRQPAGSAFMILIIHGNSNSSKTICTATASPKSPRQHHRTARKGGAFRAPYARPQSAGRRWRGPSRNKRADRTANVLFILSFAARSFARPCALRGKNRKSWNQSAVRIMMSRLRPTALRNSLAAVGASTFAGTLSAWWVMFRATTNASTSPPFPPRPAASPHLSIARVPSREPAQRLGRPFLMNIDDDLKSRRKPLRAPARATKPSTTNWKPIGGRPDADRKKGPRARVTPSLPPMPSRIAPSGIVKDE